MPSHPDRVRRNYIDGDADKIEEIDKKVSKVDYYYPCERYAPHLISKDMRCVWCGKTELEIAEARSA